MPRKKTAQQKPVAVDELVAANELNHQLNRKLREMEERYNTITEMHEELVKRTRNEWKPVYSIHQQHYGGRALGVFKRENYGLSAHELLGVLEMAAEDVRKQIRGELPPPQRFAQDECAKQPITGN